MDTLTINRLRSGGIITNYYCTSKCRHCLYSSSPSWEKQYIRLELATIFARKILALGCPLVHIGGGEPLLDIAALEQVATALTSEGLDIEYVETNSSWYHNEAQAVEVLSRLKKSGVNSLLVSISPFHNEHIPFSKVKGVLKACRLVDIGVFPWIDDFYKEVASLDDSITHSIEEYALKYGSDYLARIPTRYWVSIRGRALQTFRAVFPLHPLEEILEDFRDCMELSDTTHFHIDLFGNYIPGLCSGLSIQSEDLGKPLPPSKYPFLTALFERGIQGLLELAKLQFGFKADARYLSKCHLCFEIRKYLVVDKKLNSPELQPIEHYNHY